MINVIVLIFLIYEASEDILKRSISLNSLCLFGCVGIILRFFMGTDWVTFFAGAVTGLIVILMSVLSKGALGMGDGILFLVLGIYLGAAKNIQVIIMALFMAALVSIIILLFFKQRKYREIPFIPCILIAYLEVILFET